MATLTLLSLMSIIAIGLLTLSGNVARVEGKSGAADQARANARVALDLAIGQLQLELGRDQAISAPASILDQSEDTEVADGVANPDWIGVWRSNEEGLNSYEDGREDFFSSWLVSEPESETLERARQQGSQGQALLARVRAEGEEASVREVKAPLVEINQDGIKPGAYAYWVGDESMKARVDLPKLDEESETLQQLIAGRSAARRTAPEVIEGLEGIDEQTKEDLDKVLTRDSLELLSGVNAERPQLLDSVSPYPMSVLADVRNGGLKWDINTLFELPEDQISNDIYGRWEGAGSVSDDKAYVFGSARSRGARWPQLYAYYNLYKRTRINRGIPELSPSGNLIDWNLADQLSDFGDTAGGFRFPRIAKIIYTFSTTSESRGSSSFRAGLDVNIFVTLWNPYNAKIVFPRNTNFYAKLSSALPLKFQWFVNDVERGEPIRLDEIVRSSGNGSNFLVQSPFFIGSGASDRFEMDPGETLVFSLGERTGPWAVVPARGVQPGFEQGVTFENGVVFNSIFKEGGAPGELIGRRNQSISVRVEPDNNVQGYELGSLRTSQYCDFWIYDTRQGFPIYEHRGEILAAENVAFVENLDTIQDGVVSRSLSSLEGDRQPFAAFTMEMKTAKDSRNPSLAFLHSGMTRLSGRLNNKREEWLNERLEYKLELLTSVDDDIIQASGPTHKAGPNHGFIGSGRTAGTGQTHFAHSEIPFLPITSLAQFQHAGIGDGASAIRATYWDKTNSTPPAPYFDYAVGNSYAHPLIPADKKDTPDPENYFDHCYWANEVLWDRYFCSSLSPQRLSLFDNRRTINDVWKQFVSGEDTLLNPRMVRYATPGLSDDFAEQEIFAGGGSGSLDPEAYRNIAKHLMVKGGFNVNSTSVAAWKALLSSSRGESLRVVDPLSTNAAETEQSQGTPFSRVSIPLGTSLENSGDLGSHYRGFRDLEDEEIQSLAEKMVEEVKKRGPFLSMSEFVNRQLNTDEPELSRRGAMQAAIDSSGVNDIVKAEGVDISTAPEGMAFPEAAIGNTAMGTPGWLMQGDVLSALGPNLNVRGDTFLVRAYGESKSTGGQVRAQAWCEAVVQRVPDYVDSADEPQEFPPLSQANLDFGRQFRVISFRWLSEDEL